MKREGFESQPVGEGNCSQKKQGKGSSIPAGINHSFLLLLLFPYRHFGSAVIDSAPWVSCWRRWQLQREVAVQWASSKYPSGGKSCICQQSSAVSLPSVDLLLSTTFWSVELPVKRSAVEGLFFCLDGRARSHLAQTNVIQLFWREFTAPPYHKFCSLFAIAVQEWREKKKVELDLSHSDK